MAGVAEGFAPVDGVNARALILGSLPGARSIAQQQYYAHPRNAFWPIMAELFGIDGSYVSRCRQLMDHRIALWDVLARSPRPGSLDADIRAEWSVPNDLPGFVSAHTHLRLVLFNGRKAEQLFHRFFGNHTLPQRVTTVGAPSTSPAYAAMPFSTKLDRWAAALAPLLANDGDKQ